MTNHSSSKRLIFKTTEDNPTAQQQINKSASKQINFSGNLAKDSKPCLLRDDKMKGKKLFGKLLSIVSYQSNSIQNHRETSLESQKQTNKQANK